MNRTVVGGLMLGALLVSTSASAQSLLPLGGQQTSEKNIIAQANAEANGISYEEALRRLTLLDEANSIVKRLQSVMGNRFGGLRVVDGRTFKVEFLVTGDAQRILAPFTSRSEFLSVSVGNYYNTLKAKFDALRKALGSGPIDVSVAI